MKHANERLANSKKTSVFDFKGLIKVDDWIFDGDLRKEM
jgi:hypothetical protein